MPWLEDVAGVIEAWYPGAKGGEAIANVLLETSIRQAICQSLSLRPRISFHVRSLMGFIRCR